MTIVIIIIIYEAWPHLFFATFQNSGWIRPCNIQVRDWDQDRALISNIQMYRHVTTVFCATIYTIFLPVRTICTHICTLYRRAVRPVCNSLPVAFIPGGTTVTVGCRFALQARFSIIQSEISPFSCCKKEKKTQWFDVV